MKEKIWKNELFSNGGGRNLANFLGETFTNLTKQNIKLGWWDQRYASKADKWNIFVKYADFVYKLFFLVHL